MTGMFMDGMQLIVPRAVKEGTDVIRVGQNRNESGSSDTAQALPGVTPRDGLLLFVFVGAGKPPTGIVVPHHHLARIDQQSSLASVYSAADILVVPSLQENFPQVALEGLACGTPVVASAVGGIPEIVRSGETGRLVAPGDVQELGDAISELLQNQEMREAMGHRGRRQITENYTLEIHVRRHMEFYRTVMSGLKGTGRVDAAT